MRTGFVRALALTVGLAVTAFSGAALGAGAEKEKQVSGPEKNDCLVMNGKSYRWQANIDPDVLDSSFYAKDIKSGELVAGPIKQDRNINRTTDIGVVGLYKLDPACAAFALKQ
ncbi:MAG: hypothetical protein HY370_01230 [Proteobacteria bacterium]|nr:hypothetical protein [Pseudomonadota bacterium]